MRTTLNLEDQAYEAIKEYAEKRHISLGQAASDLVYKGSESLPKFKTKNGWVVFDLPPGSPPLTSERVKELQRLDEEEQVRRALSPGR
jgi:hypothetical protein